jgi:hypothetical protein
VDVTPATMTTVLSMHAGHIGPSIELLIARNAGGNAISAPSQTRCQPLLANPRLVHGFLFFRSSFCLPKSATLRSSCSF